MPWFKSKADDSHNTPPKLVDERLSLVAAINQSMATIEFTPSGEVCNANDNFLQAVGYQLDEIKGKHHRIFCTPEYANSQEYVQFWRDLNAGKTISGKIKRVNKHGDILWLEASYTPIINSQGKVEKVVKLAADITQRVLSEQDIKTKVDYLNDSTAIIEFKPDGTITDCNENFLKTTGYTKQQIVGKHHGMLCEPDYANSEEYRQFWQRLNNGEHSSGKFKRIDSNGNPIWLEASYQPVFDFKENLIGVIKFAIDVSKQVEKFQSVEATSEVTKKISTETVEIAEQGGLVIKNAVTEMNAIAGSVQESSEHIENLNSQSTQINSIISTIQEIADQTNLLALNAAIEAARAGDQGRGFAVVADEVRQLAARTSQSTAEISTMIHSIQEDTTAASNSMEKTLAQATRGVELANQTGEVIKKIQAASSEVVSAIDRYADIVS